MKIQYETKKMSLQNKVYALVKESLNCLCKFTDSNPQLWDETLRGKGAKSSNISAFFILKNDGHQSLSYLKF